MMFKLAVQNVRRSARDYLVYFFTMAVVTALMFSFNTLLFSRDLLNMFETAGVMEVMIGLATFFILLIIAWLINYMVRFILEKRSREFGIYLLIGFKKKEIAKLYIRENLILGAGAFAAGLVFGILLQQILMSVFYAMVQMDYHLHLEFNKNSLLMTFSCYFFCYLLALFRCKRRFKKMNIHDLMDSQKKNEEIKESHERGKRVLLPVSLVFFVIFGLFLFCYKNWDTGVLVLFLVGLVLVIYLFYTGVSAWIFCYLRERRDGMYRGNTLFLLRQFSAKIRTMSFTMGSLTALFTLALLGSAVAFMFNHFQSEILKDKYPFDLQINSCDPEDDFRREMELLEKEADVEEYYRYCIYENGTNQMNTWLYTHLRLFGREYLKEDNTPDFEKIKENGDMTYCDLDTYMCLSDYNHLRKMIGLSEITLEENAYAIHMKERVFLETGDFSGELSIQGGDGELSFAGYYTEGFSQDGHNGGDYLIIVPDAAIKEMRPYYAELAADLKGEAPSGLNDKLDDLESEGYKYNNQGQVMTEEAAEEEELGNFCCGSDTIVVYAMKNIVRDNAIPEIKYMLFAIVFPLFYVGLVFLCVALTVLSVQQLSDSAKYKFRYQVLSQIGYSRGEISGIILKQLLWYYGCPLLAALAISGVIAVYTGGKFNFYTGIKTPGFMYFLISSLFFMGIYSLYFILTYIGFKRNVEK